MIHGASEPLFAHGCITCMVVRCTICCVSRCLFVCLPVRMSVCLLPCLPACMRACETYALTHVCGANAPLCFLIALVMCISAHYLLPLLTETAFLVSSSL